MEQKTKSKKMKELLEKLSKDQNLKNAIEDFKSKASGEKAYTAQSAADFFVQIAKMGARFFGKRKAKAFVEIIEIVGFLVSLSLFVKKNLFDRPEVRQFFKDSWGTIGELTDQVFASAQTYVKKALAFVRK